MCSTGTGGCIALWWTYGIGAVVDVWHWDWWMCGTGTGGCVALGLWWTCGTGTLVNV